MSKEICAEELTGIDLSVFSKYGRGCLLLLVLYSWYLVTSGSTKYLTSTTTGTLIEKNAGPASTFEVLRLRRSAVGVLGDRSAFGVMGPLPLSALRYGIGEGFCVTGCFG